MEKIKVLGINIDNETYEKVSKKGYIDVDKLMMYDSIHYDVRSYTVETVGSDSALMLKTIKNMMLNHAEKRLQMEGFLKSNDHVEAYINGFTFCNIKDQEAFEITAHTRVGRIDIYMPVPSGEIYINKKIEAKEEPLENGLKDRRVKTGMSQAKLAEVSGVSVRMIQYYEQGVKDINKASGETLYKLSRALGCKMEDLLELRKRTEEGKKID